MADREKVIKGLECCGGISSAYECPYQGSEGCDNCRGNIYLDALTLLKAHEPKETAHWIHCKGKSHIWYCSNCGGKISYNNARRVYTKGMKPIEEVNRFCRGCGATMIGAVEET